MSTPCPKCARPLTVWYSMTAKEVVCCCDNAACGLYLDMAYADTISEALDRFAGKALMRERKR